MQVGGLSNQVESIVCLLSFAFFVTTIFTPPLETIVIPRRTGCTGRLSVRLSSKWDNIKLLDKLLVHKILNYRHEMLVVITAVVVGAIALLEIQDNFLQIRV